MGPAPPLATLYIAGWTKVAADRQENQTTAQPPISLLAINRRERVYKAKNTQGLLLLPFLAHDTDRRIRNWTCDGWIERRRGYIQLGIITRYTHSPPPLQRLSCSPLSRFFRCSTRTGSLINKVCVCEWRRDPAIPPSQAPSSPPSQSSKGLLL
jgi:hypothetical protein